MQGEVACVCALVRQKCIIRRELIQFGKAYLSNAVVAQEKAARQDQEVSHEHTSKTNYYYYKLRSMVFLKTAVLLVSNIFPRNRVSVHYGECSNT